MPETLTILAVPGMGDITPGTDVGAVIALAAPWLCDGDVLVVTSKIISKAEGRLVELPRGGPEREAARDAILAGETARPVARRGHTRIVQTHHGFVLASAGIDASNVDRSHVVLLPVDPDRSARELRAALKARLGTDVAVIITDTMGRPWRLGLTDLAIGAAGIEPLRDHRGEVDAYGNELHITQMAVIDELASAAELVKGKVDQVPVAVVRGFFARPPAADGAGAAALVRDAEHDLFSLGRAEARAAALREAATLSDADGPAEEPADPGAVERAVAAVRGAATPGTVYLQITDPPVRDKLAALVSAGDQDCPPEVVLCGGSPGHLLGMDAHRLRCALLAENLVSTWLLVTADQVAGAGVARLPSTPGDDVIMVLVRHLRRSFAT